MKKLLVLALSIITMQVAHADDTANIKIKISGAMKDNRYFLCMENVGCLSILAAEKGKVYPVFHQIPMDNLYITDANNNFAVYGQGLPSSCNVTVDTNHTITISGSIAPGPHNTVRVNQLHCTVS